MQMIKANYYVMPNLKLTVEAQFLTVSMIRHPEYPVPFFLDSDFYPPLADLPE